MPDPDAPTDDKTAERLLVLVPTGKDAVLVSHVLATAGLVHEVCPDLPCFCGKLREAAGAGLLAEEALVPSEVKSFIDTLGAQPSWSDVPLLLLTGRGSRTGEPGLRLPRTLPEQANITILERPVRVLALLSAIRSALRARRKQYEIRDYLVQQQRAANALLESEQRMRRLAESNIIGVVFKDPERITWANDAFLRMLGYSRQDLADGKLRWRDLTPPEYHGLAEAAFNEAIERGAAAPFEKEYWRKDGARVPVLIGSTSVSEKQESICFVLDLTEWKQAERLLQQEKERLKGQVECTKEELQALTASLLTAQEDERRRVARELHDDLSQKLALLAIRTEGVRRQLPGATKDIEELFSAISRDIGMLADDIRSIAHQLHPSVLEHLGLSLALKALAGEFQQRESIPVTFTSRNVPPSIPREVATCLYRIAQEALRNVAKHAGTRVRITLSCSDRLGLGLSIRDQGAGFDPAEARTGAGLGIISMEERARLVNGFFSIRSSPGEGTTLKVRVPLPMAVSPGPGMPA